MIDIPGLNPTPTMIEALRAVHQRGSLAWLDYAQRAGGARGRMWARMVKLGLAEGPPYHVTATGLQAIADYDRRRGKGEDS